MYKWVFKWLKNCTIYVKTIDFRYSRDVARLLTLLAAEVLRDGGAVTEILPPPPLTGDLLSSLAVRE